MGDRQQTIEHLRIEIAALESRLDEQNQLLKALRAQLLAQESHAADERRTHVYQRAAYDITGGQIPRKPEDIALTTVRDMGEALNALSERLDHKFAEIRAMAEVTERVNAGMFFDEVLDNVFETFDRLIPYDRIGIALIESAPDGKKTVRSR